MTEIDPKVCECCGNDEATTSVCTDCLADPCSHGLPREDTFLVAFGMSGYPSRDAAQDHLIAELLRRLPLGPGPFSATAYVEEWWVAEDDRRDGSDNDSAVFVPKKDQEQDR